MALGAMAQNPKTRISIIACGLKYFRPSRFRSKAIVEFSRPFRIPTEYVKLYQTNKREACGKLLIHVEKQMRDVTLSAPSYKELKQVYLARDLYMPKNCESKLTPEEINTIYKRFFKGYAAFRERPEMKELLEEVDVYQRQLKVFNIGDADVSSLNINFCRMLTNLGHAIIMSLVYLSFVSLS